MAITFEVPAGMQIEIIGSVQDRILEDQDNPIVDQPGVIVLAVTACDRLTPVRVHFDFEQRLRVIYDGHAQENRVLPTLGHTLLAVARQGMYVLTVEDPDIRGGGYL